MDEFAQTRGADDLFDDDFTPIAEPEVDPQPQITHRGGRNGQSSRGRGNRAQDSFSRQTKSKPINSAPVPAPLTPAPATSTDDVHVDSKSPVVGIDPSTTAQPTPSAPSYKPPSAVRGDRTATGGTPKPKLTEDELSARLAAAKLNNEKRAEAHRLAEADEASFQQREAQASQKRKEEGQAKRAMNMEREKNRLRKLGAQSGREWDEGKEEQDMKQERGSQFRRGAHGGTAYEGGRGRVGAFAGEGYTYQDGQYDQDLEGRRGGYRGRGVGQRGGRERRGRGGFKPNTDNVTKLAAPDPASDFPALPTKTKAVSSDQAQPPDTPLSPSAGGNWADEVQAAKAPEEKW